jgi:hypothetical protein
VKAVAGLGAPVGFGQWLQTHPIACENEAGTTRPDMRQARPLFLLWVGESGIVGVAWSHSTKSGPMKPPPRRRALATCR